MTIADKLNVAKRVVTSRTARQVLIARKNSPTLLFGAGTVGFVATTVLAGRATLKAQDVMDEARNNMRDINHVLEHTQTGYSEKDAAKDKAVVYARTAVGLSKLYGPAVTTGALTICAFGGSHVILSRRNAGLVAAYAAMDKSFSEYRERVLEVLGPEKEQSLRTTVEKQEVHDTKKGEVRKANVVTGNLSMYARFFDRDSSSSWNPESTYNLVFLRSQQNVANDILHSRGHIFLNDVYDMLGLERTSAGAVVGWVKGGGGDDYVDFGIFSSGDLAAFHDFATGREGGVWLDFNVDGVVYDKI